MLTKPLAREFIPGVPGRPYSPERTYCSTPPAQGEWVWSCRRVEIPGWREGNRSWTIPPGGTVEYVTDATGKVIDMYFRVCTSTWVPSGRQPEAPVCTTYPEVPAIPAIPARYEETVVLDWDAGANSVVTHAGNATLRFNVPRALGVVIGFTQDPEAVPARSRIQHGMYFYMSPAGRRRVVVFERGQVVGAEHGYAADDLLEIRRVDGIVYYFIGTRLIHTGARRSTGEIAVASSVYASGDMIG